MYANNCAHFQIWVVSSICKQKLRLHSWNQLILNVFSHLIDSSPDSSVRQRNRLQFLWILLTKHYSTNVNNCRYNEIFYYCVRLFILRDMQSHHIWSAQCIVGSGYCLINTFFLLNVFCFLLMKYSNGLLISFGCLVLKCLFNFDGFIHSFDNFSKHRAHKGWEYSLSSSKKPYFK